MPLRRLEHCHRQGNATLIQIKKAKLSQPRQNRARLYEGNLRKGKKCVVMASLLLQVSLQPFIFRGNPAATKKTSPAMAAIRWCSRPA